MTELVLIGLGRVGSTFLRAADAVGLTTETVARGEPVPAPPPGVPIVVCTRADDLAAVIAATHPDNRPDLVFVQNGMLRPLLAAHGLAENTQGLLYFAASTRDAATPGAPSLFWGPHAGAMADLLDSTGIAARRVRDRDEFSREIAIKLAWNAIFGLLGQHHAESVGETAARHRDAVVTLAEELAHVLTRGLDTPLTAPLLVDRLLAYTAAIPRFRATVKEQRWRNGYLADTARALGLPTPLHDALLATIRA